MMFRLTDVLALLVLCSVAGGVLADEMECYGSGSVAGAVIGTLIATLLIVAAVYYVYKKIWKPRQGRIFNVFVWFYNLLWSLKSTDF